MAALSRRQLLYGGAGLLLTGSAAATAGSHPRELRISLLGQSLIQHDLCGQFWPELAALSAEVQEADSVFSDLEVAIRGPRSGLPTRSDLETLHSADPEVIDCLRKIGISFLATSNNHAYDLNTGGIVDALLALRERGFAHAGTGMDITQAAGPGFQDTGAGRVAAVAFATGMVRPGGMAEAGRPGVSEIRRESDGALNHQDIARTLASIEQAATAADAVIAYQHNHYWEPENWRTPDWQRALARRCVDAGASLFLAHGAPLLQGMEMYRGRPLFHGLGSFIFQTRKPPDHYGPWAWQSLIARCRFRDGRFVGAELVPVQLNAIGVGGHDDLATRGRPALADPKDAGAILERFAELSLHLEYELQHDGRRAIVLP
jgi:poly-gamma-glutamate capsule biosynthesis protein CapA/YwtB (metallophosphatase superfamily)